MINLIFIVHSMESSDSHNLYHTGVDGNQFDFLFYYSINQN